jgi:hypothetical protein
MKPRSRHLLEDYGISDAGFVHPCMLDGRKFANGESTLSKGIEFVKGVRAAVAGRGLLLFKALPTKCFTATSAGVGACCRTALTILRATSRVSS